MNQTKPRNIQSISECEGNLRETFKILIINHSLRSESVE